MARVLQYTICHIIIIISIIIYNNHDVHSSNNFNDDDAYLRDIGEDKTQQTSPLQTSRYDKLCEIQMQNARETSTCIGANSLVK